MGNIAQPGALIALFVFCALAAFEALAPVTGAFQHLGQVIASALRVSQIIEQQPEVTFPQQASVRPSQVSLTLEEVAFTYPAEATRAGKSLAARGGR